MTITEGVWNLIATDVTYGQVHRITPGPKYTVTYVATGETAPTDMSLGVRLFMYDNSEIINNSYSIDVYVTSDAEGEVEVDL